MSPTVAPSNFDTPWKESIDAMFPYFMAYFHRRAYSLIDWARRWRPLDAELRAVLPDSSEGGKCVDKLMEVYRLDGKRGLVLVHVEVQGSRKSNFARRMYTYHYRIEDRWKLPVVSLAVLTDDQPSWRPRKYHWSLWGCALTFRFPMIKLIDDERTVDDLRTEPNPFAVVAVAHKEALATRGLWDDRQRVKLKMATILAERAALDPALPESISRNVFFHAIRMIDWVLALPLEQNRIWREQVHEKLEERRVPWLSVFEQEAHSKGVLEGETIGLAKGETIGLAKGESIGLAKGESKGMLAVVSNQLRQRFGALAEPVVAQLALTPTETVLQAAAAALLTSASPEDVLAALPPISQAPTSNGHN